MKEVIFVMIEFFSQFEAKNMSLKLIFFCETGIFNDHGINVI